MRHEWQWDSTFSTEIKRLEHMCLSDNERAIAMAYLRRGERIADVMLACASALRIVFSSVPLALERALRRVGARYRKVRRARAQARRERIEAGR
jgi:hypothetical protein